MTSKQRERRKSVVSNNNERDLFAPLNSLQWVERERLKPNDYNPNDY